jgi:uncharacterized protein YraI
VKVGVGGTVSLSNSLGSPHIVVDVLGYISTGTQPSTFEVPAGTKILGAGDVSSFSGESAKGGELTLTSTTDLPVVGGYVVASRIPGLGGGMYGKVTQVTAGRVVTVSPVPLEEAISMTTSGQGTPAQLELVNDLTGEVTSLERAPAIQEEEGPQAVTTGSGGKQTWRFPRGVVDCGSSSSVSSFAPFVDFDIKTIEVDGKTPDFFDKSSFIHVLMTGSIRIGQDIGVSGAIECRLSDAFINSNTIRTVITGPIPFTFNVKPQLKLNVSGSVRATWAKTYNFVIGFDASNTLRPSYAKSFVEGPTEPLSISANVAASIEVGIRVEVLILGAAGAYVAFGPGAEVVGTVGTGQQPCYRLDAYIWLQFGLTLDLVFKNLQREVYGDKVARRTIAEGCLSSPTTPQPPTPTGTVLPSVQPPGATTVVGADGRSGWIYLINAGSFGAANNRNGSTLGSTILRTLPNGTAVRIVCRVSGDSVYGTSIWNKLEDGSYVHDSSVTTPVPTPVAVCPTVPVIPSAGVYVYQVDAGGYGGANVRTGPSLAATILRLAPNGESLRIVCQTTGDTAFNTNVWNKLENGTFVHDSAVNTPVPSGIPGCSTPPPPSSNITVAVYGFGQPLNIRADSNTGVAVLGSIPDTTVITLQCWKRGQGIASPLGGVYDLWHRTTYNGVTGFVADTFLATPAYPAPDANQPRPGEPAC